MYLKVIIAIIEIVLKELKKVRSLTKFEIKIIATINGIDEEKVNSMKVYELIKALLNVQNYIISEKIDVRGLNTVD